MAANIRDIARAAGVSVSTVSKALNEYPSVNAETREKVLRIARELRYEPNAAARALVGQRSMTLGVFLTTGLAHPFFASLLGGIDRALREKGYDLIYLSQARLGPEYSLVRHCRTRNVEGVLAFGLQDTDLSFAELAEAELPAVFIDLDIKGSRIGMVTSDNAQAIREAVGRLHALGHRRIAYVAGLAGTYVEKLRKRGFRQGLEDHGLAERPEYVVGDDFTQASGYEAMQRLLALVERPTAVVCCSDLSALGAMQAAAERGLSVPGDISVVGFDDIEAARAGRPALTTIRQDMPGMGYAAVALLDRLITEEPGSRSEADRRIVLPTEWVSRDSCGPAATADR
ncbi:LacI family DNA-binding transcriptional regulator [Cohnella fermenti]|uniref:LacI family transcriptional regulator n=1 Tax=Cohnella fermenti TaxID=2565925 RepID=A0A4S4BQ73_9BACL|nr:LacI family DNA-binding transcriptional regulator [Cohnella fermenti]THF77078.1 LacI family transcriptional regulator [Cohnella fermenti]